jgi:hypothetical protein
MIVRASARVVHPCSLGVSLCDREADHCVYGAVLYICYWCCSALANMAAEPANVVPLTDAGAFTAATAAATRAAEGTHHF